MSDQQTSVKGKMVSLCGPDSLSCNSSTLPHSTTAAVDNTEANGHVSISHTFISLCVSHHPRANPVGSVYKGDRRSVILHFHSTTLVRAVVIGHLDHCSCLLTVLLANVLALLQALLQIALLLWPLVFSYKF